MAKLPWFPSSIKQFRRSLCPATREASRWPFGLTQVSTLKPTSESERLAFRGVTLRIAVVVVLRWYFC